MKIAHSTIPVKRIILFILFVLILSTNNNNFAQVNPEWMYFRSGVVGLADTPVHQIVIDDSLNKWCLINWSCLCKLRDSTWTIYSSQGHSFYSLSIDNEGVKWIGSSIGLIKFDNEQWTIFDTTNPGMPLKWVRCVTIDKFNNKLLLTDVGLVKFDNLNWTVIDSIDTKYHNDTTYINHLVCDSANNIWIASNTFMTKYDGKSKSIYSLADFGCSGDYIRSIEADRIGNIWIMSDFKLIKFKDRKYQIFIPDDSLLVYFQPGIRKISFDISNNVWITVWGIGVLKLDGIKFTYFTRRNSGLKDSQLYSIANDKLGNVWVGLRFGDVMAYRQGGVMLDVSENSPINLNEISFSPNPATDFLEISVGATGVRPEQNIEIFSVLGVRVLTTPALRATPPRSGGDKLMIDVSGLTSGLYFVRVGDKVNKFIKL